MLNKFSSLLTDILIKHGAKEEDRDIYIYGWEILLSTVCVIVTILILGIIFNCPLESVVYLLCFLTIRAYAGGGHASTYLGCFITSLIFYLIPLAAAKFLALQSALCALVLSIIGTLLIFLLAPRDHPNKRISTDGLHVYKVRARIVTTIWLLVVMLSIFLFPSTTAFGWWASVGIFEAGITLLQGKNE